MLSGVLSRDLGWIEVITGSMFSGKSEELIRRLRRAQIAKQKVAIFKPHIDTRFSSDHIISHNEQKIASVSVKNAAEILTKSEQAKVVGVDEGQFFGPELVDVCDTLAAQGKRVIVAGLDQDYRGLPFEPMPQIMAIAESVTKTLAICVVCGNPANRTQRISSDTDRVVVGATDIYEARCRKCHEAGRHPEKKL
jgi:thymidine kinase